MHFFIPLVPIFFHSNLFLYVWPFVLISVCLTLPVATDHKLALSRGGCVCTSQPHDAPTQLVCSLRGSRLSPALAVWCLVFLGGVVRNALETSLAGDCWWWLPVIHLLCCGDTNHNLYLRL